MGSESVRYKGPYFGVATGSRSWRRALRAVAAQEGLTVSEFIWEALKVRRPDLPEVVEQFEQGKTLDVTLKPQHED